MTLPLYNVNDVVCLAESAGLGFLEQYRVQTVSSSGLGWIYTIKATVPRPYERTALFGERISGQEQFPRYFREIELLPLCDAMQLIVDTLRRRLTEALQLQASMCTPPNPTATC